jgi:hypothetical protein
MTASAAVSFPFWAADTMLARAGDGYFDWLDHIWPAAGCAHPVRLYGDIRTVDARTGELLRTVTTSDLPDEVIYKACGNRRAAACPSCAETYRRDAYHVIRSGLVGGKGVPETVATHPAVFATFTAPSFGVVHARVVTRHACADRARCSCRADPCHARRGCGMCEHGRPLACFTRHARGDPTVGQPLCVDCYDYDAHAVWNNAAGELWRRTKQAIERHLVAAARARGIPPAWISCGNDRWRAIAPVRVSHGKAAEFQARAAVHFHALLRLDGVDPHDLDAVVPPPAGITVADLDDAIHQAANIIRSPPSRTRPGLADGSSPGAIRSMCASSPCAAGTRSLTAWWPPTWPSTPPRAPREPGPPPPASPTTPSTCMPARTVPTRNG